MSQVPPSKQRLPPEKREKPTASSRQPSDYKETFRNKPTPAKFTDPCEEANLATMRCLDRANYNRKECTEFFLAYRDCKKAWTKQRWADLREGREH